MARSDDEGCIKYGYHDHIQALGFLVSDPRLAVVVSLFSTGSGARFINNRIAVTIWRWQRSNSFEFHHLL